MKKFDIASLMGLAVIAAAIVCAANNAIAQRAAPMRGAGGHSCGEFMDNRLKEDARVYYGQWTQGYLSSYNFFAKHPPVDPPEISTIMLHAEKFCRENPLQSYGSAAAALLAELGGWKAPFLNK